MSSNSDNLCSCLSSHIMQLDEVETTAMLVMTESMIDGDAYEVAADKAAIYRISQGREAQAQAVRNTAKAFAETGAQR